MPNWKKIKQLSLRELSVRASQKWSAFGERYSILSLGRLPSEGDLFRIFRDPKSAGNFSTVEDVFDHFRTRSLLNFFPSFSSRDQTSEVLKKRFGNNPNLISQVDNILEGRFDLLGLKHLQFGTPPIWNFEPVKGKQTPLVHWSRLDYLDAELAGDKKIIWELNRHQYFMRLGRAYWLTADEKYAVAFADHLGSWMQNNPPKLGINWASSLEVAFRSISWLWAFHFFRDSPVFSARLFADALRYLYLHGLHLQTYLSTYFSPNTHLTGEALGLYYLGTVFPEFADASGWRSLGREILLEQLPIHVRPDGVYFEQSSYYHRYTTDFYLHFFLLAETNGDKLPSHLRQSLTGLLDHLMYITRPDGTTPLFGDDDGGRLAMLDERPSDDFRATLSTGAVFLNRPDYKYVAAELSEETFWLVGPTATKTFDELENSMPVDESKAFESSGYYVMRDGWNDKSNYLLFDCVPYGSANCGHAHADALAFELAANGRTLLVDSGTYTYTGSKEMRDWFRSSAAHNSLMIDGQSSSISDGPFSWKTKANCRTLSWISTTRFDYVSGTHDGYSQLPSPASHQRSILFLKNDYWLVRDVVTTNAEANVDLRYHFAAGANPSIQAAEESTTRRVVERQRGNLDIIVFGENGQWKQEEAWVSHCYAQKEPSSTFVFSVRTSLMTTTLLTLLLPNHGQPFIARELSTQGGLALEVTNDVWTDILLIRTGGRVETGTLASDFDLTWMRYLSGSVIVPDELVGINGRTLVVDGQDVFNLPKEVSYVYAKMDQGGVILESDVAR